jgi:hypothetical protein
MLSEACIGHDECKHYIFTWIPVPTATGVDDLQLLQGRQCLPLGRKSSTNLGVGDIPAAAAAAAAAALLSKVHTR